MDFPRGCFVKIYVYIYIYMLLYVVKAGGTSKNKFFLCRKNGDQPKIQLHKNTLSGF